MKKCWIYSIASVLFLTGCATHLRFEMRPAAHPEDVKAEALLMEKTPVYRLYAKGYTHFKCAKDRLGSYWQFSGIEAKLYNKAGQPVGGQKNATLIYKKEQTQLQFIGLPQGQTDDENLPQALFALNPPLSTWQASLLERRDAHGGKPLTTCLLGEVGRTQKVRFDANYVFWR